MAGTKKDFTDHGYSQYSLGTLGVTPLFNVASVGASAVGTTVQAIFVTPSRIKLSAIAIGSTAVSTINGSISFNIVVGPGAYESGATAATGSYTLTGVPLDTFDNVYTINGVVTTAPQATANTLAQQATADALAITADTATNGVTAVAVGANINLTANTVGVAGNFITTVGSSTGGDTVTANQTVLSGGSNGALTVGTVQNDNRTLPLIQQASDAIAGQFVGGGAGITTDFAIAGQALFTTDVSINAINTPNITTAGGSAVFGDVPTLLGQQVLAASDAVFERGQIITLRVFTPIGGSITNLVVSAVAEVRNLNEPSTPSELQPGQLNDSGMPNLMGQFQSFTTPNSPSAIKIQNVRQVSGVTF
jgi:hypothetical protein